MTLALSPLTVVAFWLSGQSARYLPWQNIDDLQVAAFGATLAFVAGWWLIWRPLLRIDSRGIAATTAMAVFLIGQVLVWQPLWQSSNCAHSDMLRSAQSLADLGLWCLGFVLTWWGGRRWREIRRRSKWSVSKVSKGSDIMTPATVRLAAGYSLIPLLPAVFFILMLAFDDLLSLPEKQAAFLSYITCAIIAVGVWWMIWRRAVVWTPRRQGWTVALTLLMLITPFSQFIPEFDIQLIDVTIDLSPVFALAAWFAGTGLVWQTRSEEMRIASRRAATQSNTDDPDSDDDDLVCVPCGQCDYDLRGLREARCPECGWTTTLDSLVRRGVAAALAPGD